MKVLLNFSTLLLVCLTVMSFSNIEKSSIESLESEFGIGGTACRTVRTNCGSHVSVNRSCVSYSNPAGREGALFLAQTIATQMGEAACSRAGEIQQATAILQSQD